MEVSLESEGSSVEVNELRVVVGGTEVHEEKNFELDTWRESFDNWETDLQDNGDLEVVVEWSVVEMKAQCSTVVANEKENHSAGKTAVKSWVLENVYKDEMADADFTLVCKDGVEVPVHKMIMKCSSDFFKAMMKPDKSEAQAGRGNIDCGSDVGQGLVSFVYTGEVGAETFDENLTEFLKVADEYNLVQLKEKAEERMLDKLNVTNMMEFVSPGCRRCLKQYAAKRIQQERL